MGTALRTSLIWHDEVMADVVHEKPAPVTIGTDSSSTFVTPELSLPPSFSIVTPGRRGYVLTLSTKMSGTICLAGVEHDVRAFVAAGEAGTGFHATALGPDDWGVIALDDPGDHKFFFQFVPHEVEDWNLGHPMILAGVGGYALSILALTLFWWNDGLALGEAAFRGASLASLAVGFAAIVRWAFKQNNESRASLAFSVLLHSAILLLTFQLYEKESPAVWPGPTSMTGTYLVKASEPPPEPIVEKKRTKTVEEVKPGVAVQLPMPHDRSNRLPPTAKPWEHKAKPTLSVPKDKKKKSGKDGDGILKHSEILDGITGDRGLMSVIQDMKEIDGDGHGETRDFGAGDGKDTRGGDPDSGGGPIGKQVKKKGPLDTGGNRAAVCFINCGGGGAGGGPIDIDPPSGGPDDGPYLSKEEIAKVMIGRQGLFKACFQAALDHGAGGGDLSLRFVIDKNGKVTSASTKGGSISPTVATCVKQKLYLLKFPAKGGAVVNSFPFVFTSL